VIVKSHHNFKLMASLLFEKVNKLFWPSLVGKIQVNKTLFFNILPAVWHHKQENYLSSLAQLEVQKQEGLNLDKEKVIYSNKSAIKKLLVSRNRRIDGRNNSGSITVRHRGGAIQRAFIRTINYNRKLVKNLIGKVIEIEHCPNRTSKIASVLYTNGLISYIVAAEGVKPGDIIYASDAAEVKVGNALPLKNIPDGTLVHNIEKIHLTWVVLNLFGLLVLLLKSWKNRKIK